MTPAQEAELRIAVRATQAGLDAIAQKDCHALAALLSVGRLRFKPTIIGDGTIIEAFMTVHGESGLDAANAFLDWFRSEPLFRHVVRLMDRGELRLDNPSTIGMLMKMGAEGNLPQAVVGALMERAREADPLTPQDVADALFNSDGSEK